MSRFLTIAAAQLGPIPRAASRREVVPRLIDLLRQASERGCQLVVFPECALTPFFPHWWIEDQAEIDSYFERSLPGPDTQPLFDEAARLGIGFCLGYAELTTDGDRARRFNSTVLVGRDGRIVGHYRKVHLPGHRDHRPGNPFQNLERCYFEPGDLGFPVWSAFGGRVGMLICNDRRWPESYRMLGLQGCELVLMGYNTPRHYPEYPETDRLADFHHRLSLQAGAYQNGMWVVAAAKAGAEEGVEQIGGSMLVTPSGEVVAESSTLSDELIVHQCDLDACRTYKQGVFPPRNRRVEHYGLLVQNVES
ncbi:MAG: N-carbamoyl-D-amino-acid hydrolase [Planctomycetota bacterium]